MALFRWGTQLQSLGGHTMGTQIDRKLTCNFTRSTVLAIFLSDDVCQQQGSPPPPAVAAATSTPIPPTSITITTIAAAPVTVTVAI